MKKNVKEYLAFKKGEVKLPEHLMPRKELRGKLFNNPLMERLTRSSIFVPILMHVIINTFLIWYAISRLEIGAGTAALLFVGGFFFWTFAEYMVHRFLYHTESNSETLISIQHSAHGIHHQHPRDPERLAMPPIPAILASGLFLLVFWLILRPMMSNLTRWRRWMTRTKTTTVTTRITTVAADDQKLRYEKR